MIRRFPFLMAVAILAVVLGHASSWGLTAMVWWAHRYRDVNVVPNYDQVGTLPYYILMTIKQLTFFAVPAFLFVSGYFVAYAARTKSGRLGWKVVRVRVLDLLWPYLIWSLASFAADGLEGEIQTPVEYLRRLLIGRAATGYFYVPLLCQLYLLSPLLVRWARRGGRSLLVVSGLLQLGMLGVFYGTLLGMETPPSFTGSGWPFLRHVFYFGLGIVSRRNLARGPERLHRLRWVILGLLAAASVVAVCESELIYQWTGSLDQAYSGRTLSTHLYNMAFLTCFVAFDRIKVPFQKAVRYLNTRTYGMYLLHANVLELAARAVYRVIPGMLAYQLLF